MKLNKILATSGLALTLGLTSIGTNVTPTYAAVAANPNPYIENNKSNYESKNMLKFAPYSTTGFEKTSQEQTLKSIDFATNDNSANPNEATRKAPVKEHSTTDSLTINTSAEFSIGMEMSTSASMLGLASVTSTITAGLTVSAGMNKFSSDTKTLSYGGDEIVAKPYQSVRVDYYLAELKTLGIMNTGTRITEIGNNLKIGLVVGDQYNESEGWAIGYDYYTPGYSTGEGVYNAFKRIEEINKNTTIAITNSSTAALMKVIPKGKLSDFFFVDDVAKTVSTVGSQVKFDGISGTGLTMVTSVINPATKEKTPIAEKQIQQP